MRCLCDGLERHGLIDYKYGVWEDQLVAGNFSLSQGCYIGGVG